MGFEDAVSVEWLLTNGIGGYASSTVLGLNSRKYHGLLVASLGGLQRFVCLQELRDVIETKGVSKELHCAEFAGGRLELPGFDCLEEFVKNPHDVVFVYRTGALALRKTVGVPRGRNEVAVSYEFSNESSSSATHVIKPVVNFRSVHEVKKGVFPFETRVSDGRASVSVFGNEISFTSTRGTARPQSAWSSGMYYRREAERGYDAVEDSVIPFSMEFMVPANSRIVYQVTAELSHEGGVAKETEASGSVAGAGMLDLLREASDSFIVDTDGGRTVVAGYPWFGEWGRDAMVSLPGLTLVNNRLEDAKAVLGHFLGKIRNGRIMTESEGGSPVYRDFDSTLWMVDRLLQYVKYAGPNAGRKLLGKHWNIVTEAMEYYSGIERGGLIGHRGGTWMDTLERSDAVEVQALWYNALKAYGRLADVCGLRPGIDAGELAGRFEENFVRGYWNGRYLDDCRGDATIRPNQLIALSLDYGCVGREMALRVLDGVEGSLLTPFGLRTLDPKDHRYMGSYEGDAGSRERAYHNGTVWPWLLGPYVRACVRYRGPADAERLRLFLEGFFERALGFGAVGSIGEVFDGNPPYKPGGCVSQAWSVGEPLRAYIEDVLGVAPEYAGLFA
jgi:predicted glycogen debranching enzyme